MGVWYAVSQGIRFGTRSRGTALHKPTSQRLAALTLAESFKSIAEAFLLTVNSATIGLNSGENL